MGGKGKGAERVGKARGVPGIGSTPGLGGGLGLPLADPLAWGLRLRLAEADSLGAAGERSGDRTLGGHRRRAKHK